MLKKLHPTAIVPQNMSTNEQIRAGFQEVLVDINAVVTEWNETIQPLLDSLPGGRRRLGPADRSTSIDPVENGFDGSQVYMDLTATPQVLGGFLYNSRLKRPKTIKEVVVDSHISLQAEMSKLKVLVDAVDAADTTYDDTDLRNWIRRLAADTISDLGVGDAFGTGYFGDPTKTLQYSLHQRDVNLRSVIGLGADYGITAPDFTGTTNIVADTNIIDALITLDGLVGGGATTLQEAYDGGNTIQTTIGRSVALTTASNTTPPLTVTASSGFYAMNVAGNIAFLSGATTVGLLGEKGSATSLALEQISGMSLLLGHVDGIAKYYGLYQDHYLEVATGGLAELEPTGIRFRAGNVTLGGITITNNQKEDSLRTTMEDASVVRADIIAVTGKSPKGDWKEDNSPADRVANDGVVPNINCFYNETVVKAVLSYFANVSTSTEYMEDADVELMSNIKVAPTGTAGSPGVTTDFSWYRAIAGVGETAGEGEILFLTSMPSSTAYSVTASVTGIDGSYRYNVAIHTKSAQKFAFTVTEWDPITNDWIAPTQNITLDFQVI